MKLRRPHPRLFRYNLLPDLVNILLEVNSMLTKAITFLLASSQLGRGASLNGLRKQVHRYKSRLAKIQSASNPLEQNVKVNDEKQF
ncbi:CLUMA_CG001586, isoform A [Clunio marinus]|uniref:CLUMA_CG001586, isoform A n=1 Tax=Clunio marinus TaxID=568069 RepID=A0A1J1HMQ3_9DIPT|nr:CLUMA_CG001586, isoform A [Clunio marinus]